MRLFPLIASVLLLCIAGSLLWCADACVGASGNDDEDCTCLLGGLLARGPSAHAGSSTTTPAAGHHESCRCLSDSPTLLVMPYLLASCASPVILKTDEQTVTLNPSLEDILRPPRFT